MRILFVTSNRVGDAVLSTGLLSHLIRTCPDGGITVVCGPDAAGVFARMPNRERTIVLRKRRFDAHWLPLWAWSVARRWDLVVDLRGSALAWIVRARRRAVMRPRPGHKLAQLAAVLDLADPPLPVAWTAPEDEAVAARVLRSGQPVIALGPTANWAPKTWPAERFAAVFQALAAGPLAGALPAVLGGPGEAERRLALPLLHLLPQAIDLVGRLTLPEAAACLRRASLFIGNDSGLMHHAAAAGCPTVGLFGPTSAEEYGPRGGHAAIVRSATGRMADLAADAVVTEATRLIVAGMHKESLRNANVHHSVPG